MSQATYFDLKQETHERILSYNELLAYVMKDLDIKLDCVKNKEKLYHRNGEAITLEKLKEMLKESPPPATPHATESDVSGPVPRFMSIDKNQNI